MLGPLFRTKAFSGVSVEILRRFPGRKSVQKPRLTALGLTFGGVYSRREKATLSALRQALQEIQKPASPTLLPAPAPPPPFTLVTMPLPVQSSDVERQAANTNIHNSGRAQRLRLAVRGANEGLVSTALLMMGIGDLKREETAMILYVFTGLVAGAINISIREFVSVYHDIEVTQMNSPMQTAAVSAHTFFIGGMIPLLTAAFMKTHKVVGVVIAVTLALMLFGGLRAKLWRKPIGRSCLMVMVEGWFAMLMNFGLIKLFQSLSLG
ncbi:vacuolar iron transporter homolog 2-like [Magnolia sinica]|uniref:vacuolar iron transporter homolog 2-like n=1 Tax=Magnolia sinica TaxID=86752 RepID=UPI002659DBA2|nr:vacuolar iron transporter homolog 2-like [Magnolia sinica]